MNQPGEKSYEESVVVIQLVKDGDCVFHTQHWQNYKLISEVQRKLAEI